MSQHGAFYNNPDARTIRQLHVDVSQPQPDLHSRMPYSYASPLSSTSPVFETNALLPPTRKSSSGIGFNNRASNSRQALLGRQASFDNLNASTSSLLSASSDDVARHNVGAGFGPYSAPSSAEHSLEDYYDDRDSVNEFGSSSKYNLADPTPDDIWDMRDDPEDKIHNLALRDTFRDSRAWTIFTLRGWLNVIALAAITAALVGLFAGFPIFTYFSKLARERAGTYGWNVGGTNASGQVPEISGFPSLIDSETPLSVRGWTGWDGDAYELVFSDEFNTNGRTFYPGDDPFWTAVDLHYWGTNDYEWYDPSAATTKDGNLVITLSEQPLHDLNFKSAMLQTWNQFCFTGGYIEVNVSLPGSSDVSGLWPGAWTMGNLGRAGYGATTDGTWPFTYDSCDTGTLPNQTFVNGTIGPDLAMTSGDPNRGGSLSYQPGQRLSSCTCSGEDHPGPNTGVGRGTPEIDIFEAEIAWNAELGQLQGAVSQSAQVAPFDVGWQWDNSSAATTNFSPDITEYNTYVGGSYQEAVSGITYTQPGWYEQGGGGFATYGFEYSPGTGDDAHITWVSGGKKTWKVTPATFPAVPELDISQRQISVEPHYIILNLGFSSSFQRIDWADLEFPRQMLIDYVRVYQKAGQTNVGCDPKNYPTAHYIQSHLNAYTNSNLTTWDQAGYTFPRNRLKESNQQC